MCPNRSLGSNLPSSAAAFVDVVHACSLRRRGRQWKKWIGCSYLPIIDLCCRLVERRGCGCGVAPLARLARRLVGLETGFPHVYLFVLILCGRRWQSPLPHLKATITAAAVGAQQPIAEVGVAVQSADGTPGQWSRYPPVLCISGMYFLSSSCSRLSYLLFSFKAEASSTLTARMASTSYCNRPVLVHRKWDMSLHDTGMHPYPPEKTDKTRTRTLE